MRHLIMGTAGHIDHGKTTLTKKLTGIDCDTHKEEKQRGITINLGFAHLKLDDEVSLSLVDVPGHKDFIHTMVSGASGIDFVTLVIAADSGVMPQTKEHLQIMEMLNISHGVVALTKIDTVDEEIAELAKEEVSEFLEGTFLENAPIIPVSSTTGEGIDSLKEAIRHCVNSVADRPSTGVFRLFIDRLFTVSGFGSVVTGSVISGALTKNDTVYLLPTSKDFRIRRMERHGEETDTIYAGDRASINIVGLNKQDFKRGMLLSNKPMESTTMIDAKVKLFQQSRTMKLWSDAIFLLGTYDMQVKVHLLNKDTIDSDEEALVQIHLPNPSIISVGDRFILRSTDGVMSIGGGEVIDPNPLHHRRRTEKLISSLSNIAEGDVSELIVAEVSKSRTVLDSVNLCEKLNIPEDTLCDSLDNYSGNAMVVKSYNRIRFVLGETELAKMKKNMVHSLTDFYKKNPYEESGRTVKEFVGVMGIQSLHSSEIFAELILKELEYEKRTKLLSDGTWSKFDHKVVISDEFRHSLTAMSDYLKSYGMKVAPTSKITEYGTKLNLSPQDLNHLLKYLVKQGVLCYIDNEYVHADIVNEIRPQLLKILSEKEEGMTVAEFRDAFADNRKICLVLFALFDAEGITYRKGDYRVITEKGKDLLQK